jgi:glutamate-1-semialdehyde 2,1-aminomutase
VGGEPFFVERGEGAYLEDVHGTRYIDFVMSYGPLILGHAHPRVVQAVTRQASKGLSYGTPTELEIKMAEILCEAVPGVEMVRMVNSGTEATMAAIRLARGITGRARIVKFSGSYHGHGDSLLVKAGSGAATMGIPDSQGVPESLAALTLSVPYNDTESLRAVFGERGEEIAAVITEPVAGNMGTILPAPGFLETIRDLTRQYGSLWIVDEVMTGFRVAWGGASRLFGLDPDLVCLAKVIGAGMPVGALGGKRHYMQQIAPLGPVYQAGTLSGNPVAMAAGVAQLEAIHQPGFYSELEEKTRELANQLVERGRAHGVSVSTNTIGGMFTLFFADAPPRNFDEVNRCDHARYRKFFHGMLEGGVFFPPSPFESAFPSWAHTQATIESTLKVAERVFQGL